MPDPDSISLHGIRRLNSSRAKQRDSRKYAVKTCWKILQKAYGQDSLTPARAHLRVRFMVVSSSEPAKGDEMEATKPNSLLGTSKNAIFQFFTPYKSMVYIGEKSQFHD